MVLFQHPNNKATLDLLWKYYERNGNFMAAAKILMKLAEREGYELNPKLFRNIFRFIRSWSLEWENTRHIKLALPLGIWKTFFVGL